MSEEATVFVVDDEDAVRNALHALLTVHGYQVKSFASAHQFLQSGPPKRPGCVLLDRTMPGMDGLELSEVLSHSGIDIPIVLLSGRIDEPVDKVEEMARMFAVLHKPSPVNELLTHVRGAIERDHEILAGRPASSCSTASETHLVNGSAGGSRLACNKGR